MVRRRVLERIPERLLRVGERPAGAERGEDLEMEVLILLMGDLGWRMVRVRGEAGRDRVGLVGARRAVGLLVMLKTGALRTSLEKKLSPAPLDLLAKMDGSTFSKSSSFKSAAFLLAEGEEAAVAVSVSWSSFTTGQAAGRGSK